MGSRWLLHLDLDQFVVAVELLRRPDLRGRPVVVGGSGDPTQRRMVVTSASYEARAFGVHSGMPLRMAARRCPEAVFLPTDGPAYEEASARVMATLRAFPVLVEVWGWDEAFIGGDIVDPYPLAVDLRAAVRRDTGLSCAIGIGRNKHQAKVATGFAKPGGIYLLTDETWLAVMAHRPVSALWGVGPRTTRKLAGSGIVTVADLAAADLDLLRERFGRRTGPWLAMLAAGGGDTGISTAPWVSRSRSRQVTYPQDLTDPDEIARRVRELATDLGAQLVADDRRVVRVAVIVRFAPFFTQTRAVTVPGGPTREVADVARTAGTALGRFTLDRPVRLLGVRIDLAPD